MGDMLLPWKPVTEMFHMDYRVLWAIKVSGRIKLVYATLFQLADRTWEEPHEVLGWFPLEDPERLVVGASIDGKNA